MVNSGLVIGLDGEDASIFRRTLEFFERNRIGMCTPTFVTYLPGTAAYERYKKEGRIITDDWIEYSGVRPIMVPDRMTLDELLEGYEWFVRNFFSLRSILKRSRQPALSFRFGRKAFQRQFFNYFMLNYVYRYWFGWYIQKDSQGRSMFRDRDLTLQKVQIPFQEHFKGLRTITKITSGLLTIRTN